MKVMNKRILAILLCLTSIGVKAQFSDNFTDGDFTNNPVWAGDNAFWQITNGQLNSNGPAVSGTVIQMATPSALASNVQWEFFANIKYGTSSSNYMDIFLTSDSVNLIGQNNGYFVRIGGTDDEVSLFIKQGGVVTKIIDGMNGFIASSTNNPTKVKVLRSASNQWTLYADAGGLGTNYIYQGTTVNAAVTTSSYFGVLVKYSSTNFNKHFFDDFVVGAIQADVTPPVVNLLTVISQNQLDVLFSEPVETISAQTTANYVVDNSIGSPSTAVRDVVNPALVHLTFVNTFPVGVYAGLTVSNVKDLNSNVIVSGVTKYFGYFPVQPPVYKDVIINEIFADNSPTPANIPSVEFIEIYNKSVKSINLSGWKLNGGAAFSSHVLLPSEYLVLCAAGNEGLFAGFGNALGVSMPTLTNAGMLLNLTDNTGSTIDSVRYADTWYKDAVKQAGGWTLELINPSFSSNCPSQGNWIASTNADGGTPANQNSVYSNAPDLTGPKVLSIVAIDNFHVGVCFDESIDPVAISNITNYSIDKGIGSPLSVAVDPLSSNTCVTLTLSNPLVNKNNYSLSVSNISDCSGNAASALNPVFSYYIVQPYDVVINEIMPDEAPSINLPIYEYIELYNRTPYRINMKGWKIKAGSSLKYLPDVSIEADSFLVLSSQSGAQAYGSSIPVVGVVSFPSLTNTGAALELRKADDGIIHSLTYSDTWYGDASKSSGGWSLEMIDSKNPCGGGENWHASYNLNGGTPGFRNSGRASNPDLTLPDLDKIILINPSRLKVFFTESADSTSITNLAGYSIDNGIGVVGVEPVRPDYKSVYLNLSTAISSGITYTLALNGQIKDCAGNTMAATSGRFALPNAINPSDVIINEILYNPNTDGVDFLELYNRSAGVVNLKDLYVSSIDTITNLLTYIYQVDTAGYLLFPGEYVVLTTNPAQVKKQYVTTNPKGFIEMASIPSFNISDGRAVLSLANKTIIDKLYYSDKMQYPLLNNKKGVSLERISPERPTQDINNWHSAAQHVGFATPAYQNSQYSDSKNDGSEFKVDPEIFSPDNDGHNDVMNIHYTFDGPDYVSNVNIYDAAGRIVRHLVKNELSGAQGTFSWDGITDELDKARVGIYVVFIEAFNTKGDVKNKKLTCVLAADFKN